MESFAELLGGLPAAADGEQTALGALRDDAERGSRLRKGMLFTVCW